MRIYRISNEKIPFFIGTSPIPNGMMRRFHVTSSNKENSILHEGLQPMHCVEGPKGVYSFSKESDAIDYAGGFVGYFSEAIIVEFFDNPKAFKLFAQIGGYVPPSNIIAIHHPWHELVRDYIESSDEEKKYYRDMTEKEQGLSRGETLAYVYLKDNNLL